jgi:hypothetical protein
VSLWSVFWAANEATPVSRTVTTQPLSDTWQFVCPRTCRMTRAKERNHEHFRVRIAGAFGAAGLMAR